MITRINARMLINDLVFAGNIASTAGGAMFMGSSSEWPFTKEQHFHLYILNSMFIQNAAHLGGTAVYISTPPDPKLYQITLLSTIFHGNFMLVDNYLGNYDCAVLYLSGSKKVTIVNSTFSDNNCTTLATKSSIFHLQGSVGFYRNTGYSGGALTFNCDAHCETKLTVGIENTMILKLHTSVYIVNNTAVQYGGGILVDDECTKGQYCFFQTDNLNYTQMDVRVVMEGNQAGKAGDIIFGGCLNSCYLAAHSPQHRIILTPKMFLSLFQIYRLTQSEVAASPQKVCFCEKGQFEGKIGYNYYCLSEASISQFRGETFQILAMIVGEYGCACMYCDSTW